MDLLCRTSLADHLRASLTSRLDPLDSTVWFIRRLELDLVCNLQLADSQISEQVSDIVVRALKTALSRGASGDTEVAIRFSSKSEYLAAFCFDLVDGTARGLWYYADFEPLFALPDGMVVLQTLRKHANLSEHVLLSLAGSGRWNIVRRRLSPSQCLQIWNLLQPDNSSGSVSAAQLLQAWNTSGQPRRPAPEDLLTLYLTARLANAAAPRLLWLLCPALLQYLESWDQCNRPQSIAASAQFLRLVELLGATEARELFSALETATSPRDQPVTSGRSLPSPLAGLFFAWSAFVSTDVAPLISEQKVLRYLLASRLAGRNRERTAEVDCVPLLLADLERAPSEEHLSELTLDAEQRSLLLRATVHFLQRRRWLCGRVLLQRVTLPNSEHHVLLFRDMDSGAWVFATVDDRCRADAIRELRELWPADEDLTVVVSKGDAIISPTPPLTGVSLQWVDATETDGLSSTGPEQPSKLRDPNTDLSFLSSTHTLPISTELLLLLLSRLALQTFAARLPGFAGSSSNWLSRNLLESAGVLSWMEDGAIEVLVQPPPLHLVLRMGGWDTDSFRLHSGQQVRVSISSH